MSKLVEYICHGCKKPYLRIRGWHKRRKIHFCSHACVIHPIEQRFWKKVDKKSDSECWNWIGWKNLAGYGLMSTPTRKKGELSHRISYKIHKGEIKEGHVIRHSCDNPPCCNPKHLSSGTYCENMKDMHDRKRHAYGEKSGGSKLSAKTVLEIRKLHESGMRTFLISGIYPNCSYSNICSIVNRNSWKHI